MRRIEPSGWIIAAVLAGCAHPHPRPTTPKHGPDVLHLDDPIGPAEPEVEWALRETDVEVEDVQTWSVTQALPFQRGTIRGHGRGRLPQLLILPGRYGSFDLIADSTRRFVSPEEAGVWMAGAAGGALAPALFVSDGRGVGFSEGMSVGPEEASFDVASYGPTTPNPWDLHGRVHVIEADYVVGAWGAVVVDAHRLDGLGQRPTATSLVLGMAARFDAQGDSTERALGALLVERHGLSPTGKVAWMFPTVDRDGEHLRVFFYRRVWAERQDGGIALAAAATEYTADLEGSLTRVRRFAPRTEATWSPATDVPSAFAPPQATTSRRVHVRASIPIDARGSHPREHASWDDAVFTAQPLESAPLGEHVIADPQALRWDGPETWWPTQPTPVLLSNRGDWHETGPVRLEADELRGTPPVVALVDVSRGAGARTYTTIPLEKGSVLPDLVVSLHDRFAGTFSARKHGMHEALRAMGHSKGFEAETSETETIGATISWDPAREHARVAFIGRLSAEAMGPYIGGPQAPSGTKSAYHWWVSFAVAYEVDLAGRLHVEESYEPRAGNDWELPRP